MSLKIHAKTKIYESMCMDNSFSYTFKMKFKWWQCIRKININIKSLLILIQGKQLGFSLSAIWQIHFFWGGYLCNVTSFISLDHLIKIYILRYRTHTNNQNFLVNIYIISNFKACTEEYMTVTSNIFLYFIFKQNHIPWKGSWMCTEWIIYVCWWHAICLFNMIADPSRTHYVH